MAKQERYTVGCTGWLIQNLKHSGPYWCGMNTWAQLTSRADTTKPRVFMTRAGAVQAFNGGKRLGAGYRLVSVRDAEREHIADLTRRLKETREQLSVATEPGERVGQIGWLTSIVEAIEQELQGQGALVEQEVC